MLQQHEGSRINIPLTTGGDRFAGSFSIIKEFTACTDTG
jgi:hypothetical protein